MQHPDRVTLEGRYVRLEPLTTWHTEALFEASEGQEERFRYLFEHAPRSREELRDWIVSKQDLADPMFFAVVDQRTGRAEGRQSLMRIDSANGVLELGNIYWGPAMARRPQATEALFLMADYVFGELGYRRLEWKLNNRNEPSHRAARRFGFTFEGVFRQHMLQKGENRDTAWYSMIDSEWPTLRRGYERWLDPANFDAAGQQLSRLDPAGERAAD